MMTALNPRVFLCLSTLIALSACAASPSAEDAVSMTARAAPSLSEGLGQGEDLALLSERFDNQGLLHQRYQQRLNGVPVWGGERILHLRADGGLRGLTDNRLSGLRAPTAPRLSAADAEGVALDGAATLEAPSDLWIFRHAGQDHLVWRVRGRVSEGGLSLPVVFVDALSGERVFAYENLQTDAATGTGHYTDGAVGFEAELQEDGTTALHDAALGVETRDAGARAVVFEAGAAVTSADADFGEDALSAVDVHWGLSQARQWFEDRFDRDSYDDAGAPVQALVNYDRDYVNAFWDGRMIAFGEGDGLWSDPLTTLDIAGHELSHAVTERTAGLQYWGESGGLNEATSDIFGASIDAAVYGQSAATWLLGEDAWTPGTSGDALRFMNDPAADGSSLDYYSARAATVDVHYSSGIANLAFSLASDGGVHPSGKSTVEVSGVGIEVASEVWYTALTGYMGVSTDFAGARDATLYAAEDLYGADSEVVQTWADAWDAVGVTHGSCAGKGFSQVLEEGGSVARESDMRFNTFQAGAHSLLVTQPDGATFTVELYRSLGRDRWVKAGEVSLTEARSVVSFETRSRGVYAYGVRADVGAGRVEGCQIDG